MGWSACLESSIYFPIVLDEKSEIQNVKNSFESLWGGTTRFAKIDLDFSRSEHVASLFNLVCIFSTLFIPNIVFSSNRLKWSHAPSESGPINSFFTYRATEGRMQLLTLSSSVTPAACSRHLCKYKRTWYKQTKKMSSGGFGFKSNHVVPDKLYETKNWLCFLWQRVQRFI